MVTFKTQYYTILHCVSQIKKLHISRRQFFTLNLCFWVPHGHLVYQCFWRILLMEKIPKTHHLGCYWNPAVNFMGFQLPNFPPSTGWWVGPGFPSDIISPRIPWVPSFWTMVSPCSLEKMSRKGACGVWKSPISVNELNTNRLNPSAEPLCWLEKAGGF